jgi:hypothetical protein
MNLPEQMPSTLTELIQFFIHGGETQSSIDNNEDIFYIYEMGRGIKQINRQTFADFEDTSIAWPYPFLKSAWFALLFANPENPDNFHVWFLKFPLDEQGKLIQAARDDYLKQFYERIIEKQHINAAQEAESPYGFKPSEEKMANINAIVKHQTNKLPSAYYQDVLHYIYQENKSEKTDLKQWDNWQTLGYQGLADLSSYMHNEYNQKIIEQQLAQSIEYLPIAMLKALSSCLEHHQLSKQLVDVIVLRATKHNQLDNMVACLRSISASDNQAVNTLLKHALNSDYKANIELLAVACGRCWNNLKEPWLMQLFLEALAIVKTANKSSNEAFNIMVSDLLFIPGMRTTVLEQFRNPQRSDELTMSIGNFYSETGLSSIG